MSLPRLLRALVAAAAIAGGAYGGTGGEEPCADERSQEFHSLLQHHLQHDGGQVPSLRTLEYLASGASASCPPGRAAALLALALAHGGGAGTGEAGDEEVARLLRLAEAELEGQTEGELLRLGLEWPVFRLLHRLPQPLPPALAAAAAAAGGSGGGGGDRALDPELPGGCVVIIYAYPTDEIRKDTVEFLQVLEKHYFAHLGVTYPLVVFTDPATSATVLEELQPLTSARLVPAVIPQEELTRHMPSYSCVDGIDCVAGAAPTSDAHRGVVNKTQFWSPDYLRISRYTAGPLFMHPALDQCSHFLKMDTDFYLTAPLEKDPIQELQEEGASLAYWQIHVQGQRQAGYMEAALSFLRKRGLRIRNPAFYARGRFEERAERLGIPLEEVPEALEAATVVYGCLFGGNVRFFREPLYRDFFRHMDAQRGFEQAGWSNQFFLGTAAAAFLCPSQVRRLYISGRHQESKIDVANGNVTEYLTGSSKSVFR